MSAFPLDFGFLRDLGSLNERIAARSFAWWKPRFPISKRRVPLVRLLPRTMSAAFDPTALGKRGPNDDPPRAHSDSPAGSADGRLLERREFTRDRRPFRPRGAL